jgi:pyrroloquinoline quinone biosynthesis protein B
VAISDGLGCWYLVNASPDLSVQIQQSSSLQPHPQPPRNTPIAGVFLTNADLDHVLGVFSLREGGCLDLYASPAVRFTTEHCLGLGKVLQSFCGLRWHELATREFAPLTGSERSSGLVYRAIELPGKPPPFAANSAVASDGVHSVAYQFLDQRTGKRLLVAPDVADLNSGLTEALRTSDAILFDGTFWSLDELTKIRPGARTAQEMGHITIRDCSLNLLASLPASQKIYIHINNTNPILAPESAERAAVETAGLVVGSDGMEFEL